MENEYEMLSNKELTELYNNFNNEFKKEQDKLKTSYLKMIDLSEKAINIKQIIEKRGGKLNG